MTGLIRAPADEACKTISEFIGMPAFIAAIAKRIALAGAKGKKNGNPGI
jgi:hypothetical protein